MILYYATKLKTQECVCVCVCVCEYTRKGECQMKMWGQIKVKHFIPPVSLMFYYYRYCTEEKGDYQVCGYVGGLLSEQFPFSPLWQYIGIYQNMDLHFRSRMEQTPWMALQDSVHPCLMCAAMWLRGWWKQRKSDCRAARMAVGDSDICKSSHHMTADLLCFGD